ncbi:Hypothetical predicted protein [Mytilus galloprovincialis]|uniref:Secreted protein n=1 Tax=Mytilus galloprovincialis TaxID=29158 RepID=A0A8B6E1U4_MYTGA|nr:Hypothetical predicted protein [Mytilus galloprovincialis]
MPVFLQFYITIVFYLSTFLTDVGDSLTDPVADDAPHGKEETHDGRNRKDVDNSLTIHVAGDVPHRKEETNDGRNRKGLSEVCNPYERFENALNTQRRSSETCVWSCFNLDYS